MKKRYLLLVLIVLILVGIMIFVTRLTIKNNRLNFISDDTRQVKLLNELYNSIIASKHEGKINVSEDITSTQNFINHTPFVISQKELIDETFSSYSTEEKNRNYIIKTSYDLDHDILTISLENKEFFETRTIKYKLDADRKNNVITYKVLSDEEAIE